MRNVLKQIAMSGIVVLFSALIVGCDSSKALNYDYQVGDQERIKVTRSNHYESWVEMPDKEPSQRNARTKTQELVLSRQVESVEADGTALMKVTIEKATVNLNIDTQKSKSKHSYVSTAESTESTWSNQPAIAGAVYRIRIAPDTSVLEVMGLEEARKALQIKEEDKGIAAGLLNEDSILKVHERSFVQHYPQTDVLEPVPDAMIKAKGLRKTYNYMKDAQTNQVWFEVNGEAAYNVPEDFPEPPKPFNPGQTMIISVSDMDELTIKGQGQFDLATHSVLNEQNHIKCSLLITESSLSGQFGKPGKEGDGGVMITVTELNDAFEKLP